MDGGGPPGHPRGRQPPGGRTRRRLRRGRLRRGHAPRPTPWWRCPTAHGGWARGRVAAPGPGARRAGCRGATPPWRLRHPLEVPAGATGRSRCRPPSSSPPISSPTPRGACPGASPRRPSPTAGPSAASGRRRWPRAARRLADEHGRPVRVVLSREDVVRLGPKRPPVAAGVRADGTGRGARGPHPGLGAARDAGPGRWRRRRAGPGRWRRWPCPVPRCPPTCAARGGPRRPSSCAALEAVAAGGGRAPATPSPCGPRPAPGPPPRSPPTGRCAVEVAAGRGARRGRAALLRRRAPRTRRSAGCAAKAWRWTSRGRRARPHHPLVRHPGRPVPCRRWRCRSQDDARPPRPRRRYRLRGRGRRGVAGGGPAPRVARRPRRYPMSTPVGPYTPGGARRAVARVLGADRHPAAAPTAPCWWRAGSTSRPGGPWPTWRRSSPGGAWGGPTW